MKKIAAGLLILVLVVMTMKAWSDSRHRSDYLDTHCTFLDLGFGMACYFNNLELLPFEG